ncbi:MAG: type II secretion system protein [Candidatus Gracilibacteria bacterium]
MVRNVKGFTMVELMIVIAIIGVLAVALIPSLLGSQAKARDTARQNNLNSIASAIDGYQLDNSAFPDLVSGQANCVSDSNGKVSNFSTAINATIAANIKGGSFPTDPNKTVNGLCTSGTGAYGYKVLSKGGTNSGSYVLLAISETKRGNLQTSGAWSTFSSAESLSGSIVQASGTGFAVIY